MRDYAALEHLFIERLGLERRPIAVSFRDQRHPASRRSQAPQDHYNCPIGVYTHNIPLPPARQPELDRTLGPMAGLGYLRWEEMEAIARLKTAPADIVYSPLAKTPPDPDAVLFAGRPRSTMLLQEAALRAGVAAEQPLLARPTCMAIPAALAGGAVASNGCIGNRVYTGIGDDGLYVVLPGKDAFRVAAEIATIAAAVRSPCGRNSVWRRHLWANRFPQNGRARWRSPSCRRWPRPAWPRCSGSNTNPAATT